jgi:orotate phosphoribosyltransferase
MAGLIVERALCVLDREEGGGQALAALGVNLEPLFRRADLGMPVA